MNASTDQHIIQKRDLIEMLRMAPDWTAIMVEMGELEFYIESVQCSPYLAIIKLVRRGDQENKVSDLENEIANLESKLRDRSALLFEFDSIMQSGGTPDELDAAMKELHDKVLANI